MAAKFAEVWIKLGLKKEGFDKEVKQTEKTFMGLNKSALKVAAGFAAFGAAAVVAGKQIYALGKHGAMVTQTAESFEFLSEKLGLAPDLLEQLRKASRGTITDMKLMSSTATLLAGTTDEVGRAMGDATPQLMEIAKAANKLNPSLGTTAHMYESLSLGIKRQSPLILDNLGLTIKLGASNEAYAKKLGKTVEQLTAEEKQIALLNATLAAGDNLLAQVGGTTDSAVDSFAQAETAVANLKDGLSELVYVGIAPAVSGFAGLVQGALDNRDAYAELKSAMDAGLITLDEHNQLQWDMIDGIKTTSEVMDVLAQKEIIQEAQLRSVGGSADYLAVRFTSLGNLAQESMGEVTGAIDGTTSAQDLLNIALKTYNERLLFNLASEHLSTEASMELAYQMGLVDEKTISAYKSVDILTDQYNINAKSIRDGTADIDGYIAAINRLRPGLANLKNDLGGAAGEAARLGRAIRGLKGKTIVIKTKFVTIGHKSGVAPRQHGGPVTGGGSYLVGEAGPEVFVPHSGGNIVPNNRSATIGTSMMQGVSKGVRGEYEDAAMDTMRAMKGLIGTAEKTLGISSPSAMFYDIGLAMMKGLERGIERGTRGVDDALSLVMKGMKETAESGMNDITNEVDYGLRQVEFDFGTMGGTIGASLYASMDAAGTIVESGMAGITNTVDSHVRALHVSLEESYNNMLRYWENAQSVFGGPSPYSGQLPDWPTTSPPPPPYTQPPKSDGDYGVLPPPPTSKDPYSTPTSEFVPPSGYIPPSGTYGQPPSLAPYNPPVVQNTLIINTNAPVESDVPDLLLLRAWASG